jgi:hypothetical protein
MKRESPDEIKLPVGGITETCGLCGSNLESIHKVDLVGLNGILCDRCTSTINHYTPMWGVIELPGNAKIELWQYAGHPESPYFQQTAPVLFVDSSGIEQSNPQEVRAYYDGIAEEVKEIIWYFAAGITPPDFSSINIPLNPVMDVVKVHKEAEDDNPYSKLSSYLPRPYLVDGGNIAADFSDCQFSPEEAKSFFLEDETSPLQQDLDSLASTGSQNTPDNEGDSEKSERKSPTTNSNSAQMNFSDYS